MEGDGDTIRLTATIFRSFPQSAKVRQLAAAALRDLRSPKALDHPIEALGDDDVDVARYVADAVGAIASSPGLDAQARRRAIEGLDKSYTAERSGIVDAVVENIQRIAVSDPDATIDLVQGFAERLGQAAKEPPDYARLVRLLERFMRRVPPDRVDPGVLKDLRRWLGYGHLRSKPPEPKKAVEVFSELVKKDPPSGFRSPTRARRPSRSTS